MSGTPLTGARAGSKRIVTRDKRDLAANAKVFKGALAVAIISGTSKGYYKEADASLVATAVGRFRESVDNTGGADGDKQAQIDFFRDRVIFLLDNDAGTPLDATDREQLCYALDDHTASAAVATCDAGVLYDVTDEGVWVEISDPQLAAASPGLSNVAPVNPSSTAASAGIATLAARQDHKHQIALATPAAEGLMSGAKAGAFSAPVANITALKAIAAADRANGMIAMVLADNSLWQFNSTSTAADTSQNMVATPAVGTGRWLRLDKTVALSLPIDKTMADNATIFTVPVGCLLKVREAWFDVLVDWSGGSASAIGVHASPAGWTTKGDILGGATGDVAATLVASSFPRMTGTVGAKLDTFAHGRLILTAADTLNYDKITSTFTAGSANVRVLCDVIANAGA